MSDYNVAVLVALRVENLILMDSLELSLEPGLNVLTGETGAGKSIVIGALGLVLGGRASSDAIRPGADEAIVEALFDLRGARSKTEAPITRLIEEGIVDDELVVRRVINASGRSRAYINGRLVAAAELAAIAPALADVASQHESVALTDPSTHLGHLDRFAELSAERAKLSGLVESLEELAAEIAELRERERSRGERDAFLSFQLQSIEQLDPQPNELDELTAERKRLRHAGRLTELTQRAADLLDGDDGICDAVGRVAGDLRQAAELDAQLDAIADDVNSAWTELSEAARACARYLEDAAANPERLGEVEERLYRLEGLLRQHGPTLDDVLEAAERLRGERDSLAEAESLAERKQTELDQTLPQAAAAARRLSDARREAASKLGHAISSELAALGMGDARVQVEVDKLPGPAPLSVDGARLSRSGIDRVEFLIAANRGIEPKPLRKIASGGELSRSLLALKRVLAEHGPAGLYVFDEVDAGVGGAIADRIGMAIADVARHHQVLCITHLAPIAAFADAHFVVSKSNDKGGATARSEVRRLTERERVAEVARMLSGKTVTPAAMTAAGELIDQARAQRSAPTPKKPVSPEKKAARRASAKTRTATRTRE